MAEIASIIMQGLSEKKSVSFAINNQKNLDRARMDRIIRESGVSMRRALEMQAKAKSEKEVGQVAMLTGAASAAGKMGGLAGTLEKLGLETAGGQVAAGRAMLGVQGAIETARKTELSKRVDTARSESLELDLAGDRRSERQAQQEERLDGPSQRFSGLLADATRKGADTTRTLESIKSLLDADDTLTDADRSIVLGQLRIQALNLNQAALNIGDRDRAMNLANRALEFSDESPVDMTPEEYSKFRQTLLDETIDPAERAMLKGDLDSIEDRRRQQGNISTEFELKRNTLNVSEKKAQSVAVAAELKLRNQRKGARIGQEVFGSSIGVIMSAFAGVGGSPGDLGGLENIRALMNDQSNAVEDDLRTQGVSEIVIKSMVSAVNDSMDDFLAEDNGLRLATRLADSNTVQTLLDAEFVASGGSFLFEGTSYSGPRNNWPPEIQRAFVAKAISRSMMESQTAGRISFALQQGLQVSGGSSNLVTSSVALANVGTAIAMRQLGGAVGGTTVEDSKARVAAILQGVGVDPVESGSRATDPGNDPNIITPQDAGQDPSGGAARDEIEDLFSTSRAFAGTPAGRGAISIGESIAEGVTDFAQGAVNLGAEAVEAVGSIGTTVERRAFLASGVRLDDLNTATRLKEIYDDTGVWTPEQLREKLEKLAPTFLNPEPPKGASFIPAPPSVDFSPIGRKTNKEQEAEFNAARRASLGARTAEKARLEKVRADLKIQKATRAARSLKLQIVEDTRREQKAAREQLTREQKAAAIVRGAKNSKLVRESNKRLVEEAATMRAQENARFEAEMDRKRAKLKRLEKEMEQAGKDLSRAFEILGKRSE